jgi:flagellar motor switch protein FliG
MSRALAHAPALDRISGTQKAAILCMMLGPEVAARITQQLSTEEAEAITFEIARMERVSADVAEAVLIEWVETLRAANTLTDGGGVEFARQILERAFGPQKAAAILKRIQSQLGESGSLHRLRNADPQQLGNRLRGEHPQTIALILAHLDPAQVASVMKEIDPAIGSEVMLRIARMEKVSPEMLSLIERSLGAEADLNISQGMSASGGPAAVAAILNVVSSTLEKELMDGIAAQDAALCEEIKNLMFVFEDLITVDDRGMQRLLREVDSKELALAMKAASEELKAKILGAMSQRAVAALQEEIDFLGPVRLRDVEAAQASIVAQVRALEEAGEIVITGGGGGGDDVLL